MEEQNITYKGVLKDIRNIRRATNDLRLNIESKHFISAIIDIQTFFNNYEKKREYILEGETRYITFCEFMESFAEFLSNCSERKLQTIKTIMTADAREKIKSLKIFVPPYLQIPLLNL